MERGLAETLSDGGKLAGTPGRIAIPVAGDDAKAKATAFQLVDATGFDALDAGPLAESWRQQPGTPGYCTELTLHELEAALAAADRRRAPENREALIKEFAQKAPRSHMTRWSPAIAPSRHDGEVTHLWQDVANGETPRLSKHLPAALGLCCRMPLDPETGIGRGSGSVPFP